ncbi:hypothetical protein, partial [Paenibacillus solani]|uniref:hypothetical protein n=1 Tax=Paenibacillus solani TaxID=1705565 RepID=UPI003D29EE22
TLPAHFPHTLNTRQRFPGGCPILAAAHSKASLHQGSVAVEETWRSPLKPGNILLVSSQFPGFNSDRNGYTPPTTTHFALE